MMITHVYEEQPVIQRGMVAGGLIGLETTSKILQDHGFKFSPESMQALENLFTVGGEGRFDQFVVKVSIA